MAIKIGGTTVINDSKQIENIGIATVGFGTFNNAYIGVATIGTLYVNRVVGGIATDFPKPIDYYPTIGSTNISFDIKPVITFDQNILKGTGNITIRRDTATGTAIATVGVASTSVVVNQNIVTINFPNDIVGIGSTVPLYVVVDGGAFIGSVNGLNSVGIDTYFYYPQWYPFVTTFNPTRDFVGTNTAFLSQNIVLTFDRSIGKSSVGLGKTITLRLSSASGVGIETFTVATSTRVTISSGNIVTINPTADFKMYQNIWVLVDESSFIASDNSLTNRSISDYNFYTPAPNVGDPFSGGNVICKASNTVWIVAPSTSEVIRNWYAAQSDPNNRAVAVTGETGWFFPAAAQLQNPGYSCRQYWDSYTNSTYWTTSGTNYDGCVVNMDNGSFGGGGPKNFGSHRARSFKTISY